MTPREQYVRLVDKRTIKLKNKKHFGTKKKRAKIFLRVETVYTFFFYPLPI